MPKFAANTLFLDTWHLWLQNMEKQRWVCAGRQIPLVWFSQNWYGIYSLLEKSCHWQICWFLDSKCYRTNMLTVDEKCPSYVHLVPSWQYCLERFRTYSLVRSIPLGMCTERVQPNLLVPVFPLCFSLAVLKMWSLNFPMILLLVSHTLQVISEIQHDLLYGIISLVCHSFLSETNCQFSNLSRKTCIMYNHRETNEYHSHSRGICVVFLTYLLQTHQRIVSVIMETEDCEIIYKFQFILISI